MALATKNVVRKQVFPAFEVHMAKTVEDKARLFRFRYKCFHEELGRDSPHLDHEKKIMRDELDRGAVQLFMMLQGQIVAAVRISLGGGGSFPDKMKGEYNLGKFTKHWPSDKLSLTDRLFVDDRYKTGNAVPLLLSACYKIIRKRGIQFDFTHCEPYLVQLYEMLGYRRYTESFVDEDDGFQLPLVLLTEDLEHLTKSRSPFSRIALMMKQTTDSRVFFMREFPDYARRSSDLQMDEERFWQYLTEKLNQTPLVGIPLLANLAYVDAKKFLASGTSINCKNGDKIVRAGDVGNEMFVILSGTVEVRAPQTGAVIRELKRGEIFGELAFLSATPRIADVVAIEPVEVLIITQGYLKQAMKTMPMIASQVLLNMSLILVNRLQHSSQELMKLKNQMLFSSKNDDDDDEDDDDPRNPAGRVLALTPGVEDHNEEDDWD